jgi:hypothetical protein
VHRAHDRVRFETFQRDASGAAGLVEADPDDNRALRFTGFGDLQVLGSAGHTLDECPLIGTEGGTL